MEKHDLVIIGQVRTPSGQTIAFQEIGGTDVPHGEVIPILGAVGNDNLDTVLIKLDHNKKQTDAIAGKLTPQSHIHYGNLPSGEVNGHRDEAQARLARFKSGTLNIVADPNSAINLLEQAPSEEGKATIHRLFDVDNPTEAIQILKDTLTR